MVARLIRLECFEALRLRGFCSMAGGVETVSPGTFQPFIAVEWCIQHKGMPRTALTPTFLAE